MIAQSKASGAKNTKNFRGLRPCTPTISSSRTHACHSQLVRIVLNPLSEQLRTWFIEPKASKFSGGFASYISTIFEFKDPRHSQLRIVIRRTAPKTAKNKFSELKR